MAGLTPQAETAISNIPPCAASAIEQGILSSPCGLNIACICRDDSFIDILQQNISKTCDFQGEDKTLAVAKTLCVDAIPSLADSKQSELIVTIAMMMVLATLAVLLRLYCRKIIRARLGADDYAIMIALLLAIGLNINSLFSIKEGSGLHLITLTLVQIDSFAKTDEASQVIFTCAITAIKLSVLLFYRRFFPSPNFRKVALVTGCVNILWCIGSLLTAFLHCRPLAFYWDKSIPGGVCANDNTIGYSITAAELVTDIVVLVLPIPWLSRLKLAARQKFAVIGLFMLGSFVCVAGIVRIPLLGKLKISDATWTAIDAGVWINVECNIGIVSACLPLLRPLFTTQYPSSPASHLARLFRSLSSFYTPRGSQGYDTKERGANSSADSGTIIVRPRNTYQPPANSGTSESTLDIGPEPPPKDEKYMTWGLSPACNSGGSGRSTFETVREEDVERQAWRSTFETTRDNEENIGSGLEDNRNRDSCKLTASVLNLNTFPR